MSSGLLSRMGPSAVASPYPTLLNADSEIVIQFAKRFSPRPPQHPCAIHVWEGVLIVKVPRAAMLMLARGICLPLAGRWRANWWRRDTTLSPGGAGFREPR